MADIVERLRDRSDHFIAQHAMDTMDAAADEIERLREAVAIARTRLLQIERKCEEARAAVTRMLEAQR